MRTVDPDVWFRGSLFEIWTHRQTDTNLETRLRRSLRDALLEFWRHASLRDTLITNQRCVTTCDSIRNFLGCIVAFILAIALVTFNMHQQMSRPPLQVNDQSSHSVTELLFPAVAICTNNVISKTSMQEYITLLLSRGVYNSTIGNDILTKIILSFGAFLSKSLPRVDLEHTFKDSNFNVSDLMYQLSPKCSELLKYCAWQGVLINCSDLFAARITPLGFCCVFNSRYQPEDVNASVWSSNQVGQNNGLIVMYTEDDEDSAFVRHPALGVEVLIFDSDEFPLLETGVTRLYPVNRNASMFFSLTQHDIRISDDLASYREGFRHCRLRDIVGPRTARSSYGWCLLQCRRRTIAALCNCVPFPLMPGGDDVICTPKHLPCLNKHKEKFLYYYPGDNAGAGLTEEMQDSLNCHDCLPDCGRRVYSADVSLTSYSLEIESKLYLGLVIEPNVSLANSSILRFFYNSNQQSMFLVEPAVRWYEGIAFMACQWVILLTATTVTAVELVFHLTFRWAHHFRRRTILLRTLVKLDRSSTESADLEDVHLDCFKDYTEKGNNSDILEPPVKQFYF